MELRPELPSLSIGRANGVLRERPPVPPRREEPPPKLAASLPGSPAKNKKKGQGKNSAAPPFNRLQLAAALIEYDEVSRSGDDVGGSGQASAPGASKKEIPIGRAGYWDGAVEAPEPTVLRRAHDSAIFTPFREAPKQIDFFSDLDVPGSEAMAMRDRVESKTSFGSSGFGLATVTGGQSGRASTPSAGDRVPEVESEPIVDQEAEEQETLADWGLDSMLNKLGSAKDRPRPGPPSRTHSTFTELPRARVSSDSSLYGPPPASPASDTRSLPDVLDRSIFRPPSAPEHPLLKGHTVLARPALANLSVNDLDERRRAQSFDVIRRPDPPLSPIISDPGDGDGDPAVRQRRVTMLDAPHPRAADDLSIPPRVARSRPPGRVPRMSSDGPSRSSHDIVERYRASVAMLTEPFDAASEAERQSGDFTVPMPSEYTSRFDPKVAQLMEDQKKRDAELNATPRVGVPEVLVEGQEIGMSADQQGHSDGPVFDDQQRLRFPGSLNPKVLIMPAPLTPPDLPGAEDEDSEEEGEEDQPEQRIERPAGKLYGRSLIDELRDRKLAQKSRQKAFAGDNRPKMFANSQSVGNLSLMALQGQNSVGFPTSPSVASLGAASAVDHARSLYMSATLASSRAHASVFGIDRIMERELEKVRVIEAKEAEVRAEEQRVQEEQEAALAEEARKKAEKKAAKRKTHANDGVQKVADRLEEQWHQHEVDDQASLAEPVEHLELPHVVETRAPSLDLPGVLTGAAKEQKPGGMHDWFSDPLGQHDDESSDDDNDGFSDANSIARHLDQRTSSSRASRSLRHGVPRIQHAALGSTASVQRTHSIASEAALLSRGRETPMLSLSQNGDDGSSDDDEPLVSLAQRKQAEARVPSASGLLELPTLDFGQRRFTELDADGRSLRSVQTAGSRGSDGDDVPLGLRASVSSTILLGTPFLPPAPMGMPVWQAARVSADDVPLGRFASMSFAGAFPAAQTPAAWPLAAPSSSPGDQGDATDRPPTILPERSPQSGRRPSVPHLTDLPAPPSLGVAVNDETVPSPPVQAWPQTPGRKGLQVPESPMERPFGKSDGGVPISPGAVSSNASSPGIQGRTVARQDTLAALEGGGTKKPDGDADDEVPLGYARAALRVDSTRRPVEGNSSSDEDDDRPLAYLNPLAAATKQMQDSQTMMLLMQQQDAAFAGASTAPTLLGMPFGGMAYAGPPPIVPGGLAGPHGSMSFLTQDLVSPQLSQAYPQPVSQPVGGGVGYTSPAEAYKRESISRWRVGVQPDM